MPHEIQIGDHVMFLENRPAPDILSVGLVGQVVDPGHAAQRVESLCSVSRRPRILGRSRKSGARVETGPIGRLICCRGEKCLPQPLPKAKYQH